MAYTNKATVRAFASAIAAALFINPILAATPIAVWDSTADGMGLNTTQGGLTISAGTGNSFTNGNLVIAGSGYYSGGYIDLPSDLSKVSVLIKYSNFGGFTGHDDTYPPVFMSVRDNDGHEVGLHATNGASTFSWYWFGYDVSSVSDRHEAGSPAFVPAAGYALFSYNNSWGMRLCSGTSLTNMTTEEKSGYNFSGATRTLKQIGLGGAPSYTFNDGWPNLVIEKVALFTNEFLAASDVADFKFPTLSVSEINAIYGSGSEITVDVDDGGIVVGDTTFTATKVNFRCAGSFTLKPPAGNTATFDFSGVTGRAIIPYDGSLPTVSGTAFTATTIPTSVANAADWTGTIWLRNITVTDFNVNSYGNASSLVRLTGIEGWLRAPGNYTYTNSVPVELSNEGAINKCAFKITNGNSANSPNPLRCTAFVKIMGDGTLCDDTTTMPVLKVFDLSEFSGDVNFSSACLLVCDATASYDSLYDMFDANRGSICIESGKSMTLPCGKTWTANSITINGQVNFTTSDPLSEGMVLFTSTGLLDGDNAVYSINGTPIEATIYKVSVVGSNLQLKRKYGKRFVIR